MFLIQILINHLCEMLYLKTTEHTQKLCRELIANNEDAKTRNFNQI